MGNESKDCIGDTTEKEDSDDKNLKEQVLRQLKHVNNATKQKHNEEQKKRKKKSELRDAENKWVNNEDRKTSKKSREAQPQQTIKQKELKKENTEESIKHK